MSYALIVATIQLVAGALILILGLTLLREHPRHALNRVVALMLFFAGLGTTLGSSDFLLPLINPKLEQRGIDLVTEFSYVWEFFFPLLLMFVFLFPVPRPIIKRAPVLKLLIFLPYVGHTLLIVAHAALGPSFGIPTGPEASIAWTVPRLLVEILYGFHRTLFSLVNTAYVIVALIILRDSFRRTSLPILREQLRVIGWGMGFCAVLSVVSTLLLRLLVPGAPQVLRTTVLLLALIVGCGSVAFAMVRYRFLEASLLVRRAILYAFSTAVVVGLYLALVNQLGGLFSRITGTESPVFQGLLLVLALILYQPLLAKMEDVLEGLLLRERTDPRTALRDLSERIVTRLDPAAFSQDVVDTLHDCLLPDRVMLLRFVGSDGRPEVWARRQQRVDGDLSPGAFPARTEISEMDVLTPIAMGEEAAFAVPLRHQNEVLGALLLGRKLTGRRYTSEDATLLSSVANQVSVALKNAELHAATLRQVELERDLITARNIQESFLPRRFPERPEIDIFGHNIPSREVGGDYYDVLEQGDEAVLLAVADVSGKGVPAALLASMLQASLRTLASTEISVGQMMGRLNRLVCESTSAGQFATCFLARVDLRTMRLTYANAGHNFPFLLREPTDVHLLDHSDLVLGFLPATEYGEASVDLRPGDRLVAFTDGISEAAMQSAPGPEPEFLGEEGLLEILQGVSADDSARALVGAIQRSVSERCRIDAEADDMTLLVMKVRRCGEEPQAAPGHAARLAT